jgi:hypothetical protein
MRAISQYGEYGIQIQPQRQKGMGDGSIQITQEPIYAKFKPMADAAIYEVEIERAHKTFAFRGRYQHIDEATPADIAYRLSVLDTEQQGWDEETRLLVEARLVELEPLNDDFFIATEKPLDAPFPKWDTSELPAFQLVANLVEMGFDLSQALSYERVFGPARAEVIEALEAVIADQQVEETVSA